MADLRKAARGRECQSAYQESAMEILKPLFWPISASPGYAEPESPPDLIATIACSSCHDEIDRRTHLVDAEYAKSVHWRAWPARRLSG
jgi:hypothetical protein